MVLEIWVDDLKDGEVRFTVVPDGPVHELIDPFGIDRPKLAIDVSNEIAVPTLREVGAGAQTFCGFVETGVRYV